MRSLSQEENGALKNMTQWKVKELIKYFYFISYIQTSSSINKKLEEFSLRLTVIKPRILRVLFSFSQGPQKTVLQPVQV